MVTQNQVLYRFRQKYRCLLECLFVDPQPFFEQVLGNRARARLYRQHVYILLRIFLAKFFELLAGRAQNFFLQLGAHQAERSITARVARPDGAKVTLTAIVRRSSFGSKHPEAPRPATVERRPARLSLDDERVPFEEPADLRAILDAETREMLSLRRQPAEAHG